MNRRGKVFGISTAAVGITVLLAAGIILKGPMLERWYIYQLENGDDEEKGRAVEGLADVGEEEATVKLREHQIRVFPTLVLRKTLPGRVPLLKESGRGGPLDLSRKALDAIAEIRARIGWERQRAATVRYMKDPTADAMTRAWIAQLWILATTPNEVIAGRLRNGVVDRPAPGTELFQEYLEDRPAAIAACMDALSSRDRHARAAAAFTLSLCGTEARHALPALRKALNDHDKFVSEAASDALERIK